MSDLDEPAASSYLKETHGAGIISGAVFPPGNGLPDFINCERQSGMHRAFPFVGFVILISIFLPVSLGKADAPTINEQLISAAEQGDTPTVMKLLSNGADINGRDARGRTPVMAATHGNRVTTVKALIQAGADINLRDNMLDNPFLYSGAEGLLDILKLTIAAGADPKLTNRYGGTALIPAAQRGHVEVVREILMHTKVDINHINNVGWTALLEAIVHTDGGIKHQQIVQLLVDHGADVSIPDKEGVAPLQHAQKKNFAEIVDILTKASTRNTVSPQ